MRSIRKIKVLFVAVLCIACLATALFAAEVQPKSPQQKFEEDFGTIKEKVPPRPIDKKAAELSNNYSSGKNTPVPILGNNGAVVYTYGASTPRILCRPLRVTDIELEAGETVTNAPFIGDSVNWQILPSSSGQGSGLTYHVMVKPSMPDIMTNLIVHTNKRSYHFDLVSSKYNYTPHVAFTYPQEDNSATWDLFLDKQRSDEAAKEASKPYSIGQPQRKPFDYDYVITAKTKNVDWFPNKVYNDGVKTYIEFPANLHTIEAPVFMLSRAGRREMVNYRLVGNTYVVDYLFDRGLLLAGTGKTAKKVLIEKGKKSLSTSELDAIEDKSDSGNSVIIQLSEAPKGKAASIDTTKKKEFTFADYLNQRKAARKQKAEEAK